MKIQTSKGPVELTAAMVCKGMVFEGHRFLTTNGLFTCGHKDAWGAWQDQRTTSVTCPEDTADRLLGCDPTIATRADCEHYGVHGDAAAHGFARLRDGGAVDLRREAHKGMVVLADGQRKPVRERDATLYSWERFIGLNADLASPEDVRRMCCGAEHLSNEQYDPHRCTLAIGDHDHHEDLATGVKWGASGPAIAKAFTYPPYVPDASIKVDGTGKSTTGDKQRAGSGVDAAKAHIRAHLDSAKGHFFTGSPSAIRRVLAACDLRGDVHRLAPGSYRVTLEGADAVLCDAVQRWLSDNSPMDVMYEVASTRPTCGKCAQTITDPTPMRFASDRGDGVLESALICARCAREIEPGAMTVQNGRIVPRFGPSNVDSMPHGLTPFAEAVLGLDTFDPSYGSITVPLRPLAPTVRATWTGIAGLQAPAAALQSIVERMAQHDESGVLGFCAFVAGLKRWAASPEGKRAAQERALVALVNAVPEGLDPIGWRAAVLACHESYARLKNDAPHPEEWGVLAAVRGCPTGREGTWKRAAEDAACAAYHRAITPAAPVHRVRATWKTRGPVLAVDDGRDE